MIPYWDGCEKKKIIGINVLKHETIQLQTTNNTTQNKKNKSHRQNIFQKLQTAAEKKNWTVQGGNKKHVHHKGGGEQSSMVQIRNTPWNKCIWCCRNLNMAVTKTEHIKSKAQTRVWARSFNNTVLIIGAININNSWNATNAPLAARIVAAKLYKSNTPDNSCLHARTVNRRLYEMHKICIKQAVKTLSSCFPS